MSIPNVVTSLYKALSSKYQVELQGTSIEFKKPITFRGVVNTLQEKFPDVRATPTIENAQRYGKGFIHFFMSTSMNVDIGIITDRHQCVERVMIEERKLKAIAERLKAANDVQNADKPELPGPSKAVEEAAILFQTKLKSLVFLAIGQPERDGTIPLEAKSKRATVGAVIQWLAGKRILLKWRPDPIVIAPGKYELSGIYADSIHVFITFDKFGWLKQIDLMEV